MYRQRIWVWLLVLLSTLSAGVYGANAADEALVATFLAKRQALVGDAKVDLAEMSKAIRSAVADGERLEREASPIGSAPLPFSVVIPAIQWGIKSCIQRNTSWNSF
jgi:hypothetical protein